MYIANPGFAATGAVAIELGARAPNAIGPATALSVRVNGDAAAQGQTVRTLPA
jgi:hypothetical protein